MTARLWSVAEGTYPARPVAVVRIVVGAAALLRGLEAIRILVPLTDDSVVRIPYVGWMPAPQPAVVALVLAAWLAAAALFTAGYRTRLAGGALSVTMGSSLLLDQQAYSNHLYLLTIVVALLTVAGPGAALSLDARRWGAASRVALWPVVLIKIQVTVVYLFAVVTKFSHDFLSGSVIGGSLGRGLIPVPDPLLVRGSMMLVAVIVIAIELLIAFYLWLPGRRGRAICLGVVLHGSIPLLMTPVLQLAVFSTVMMATYLLFLDIEPGSVEVGLDRRCSYCRRWGRRLHRLDLLRAIRLAPVDAAAGQGEDGPRPSLPELRRGLGASPFTFLVAPFLDLPGVRPTAADRHRRRALRHGCRTTTAAAFQLESETLPSK